MAVLNPYRTILEKLYGYCKELDRPQPDPRFRIWFKWVKGWGDGPNGFAVEGEFIKDSTQELNPSDFPKLVLAAWTHGSRKYNTTEYELFIVDIQDGEIVLESTGLHTSTKEGKGWALRLRDNARQLLAKVEARRQGKAAEAMADPRVMIQQLLEELKADYPDDARLGHLELLLMAV